MIYFYLNVVMDSDNSQNMDVEKTESVEDGKNMEIEKSLIENLELEGSPKANVKKDIPIMDVKVLENVQKILRLEHIEKLYDEIIDETDFSEIVYPKFKEADLSEIIIIYMAMVDAKKKSGNINKIINAEKEDYIDDVVDKILLKAAIRKHYGEFILNNIYISKKSIQTGFNKVISYINNFKNIKMPELSDEDVKKFNDFYKKSYLVEKRLVEHKNDKSILHKSIKMFFFDFIINNINIHQETYVRLYKECDEMINLEFRKEVAAGRHSELKDFNISSISSDETFKKLWKENLEDSKKNPNKETPHDADIIKMYTDNLVKHKGNPFDVFLIERLAYVAYITKNNDAYLQSLINVMCQLRFDDFIFREAFGEDMARDLVMYRASKYNGLLESLKKGPTMVSVPDEMDEKDKVQVLKDFEQTDLKKTLGFKTESSEEIMITEDALKDL